MSDLNTTDLDQSPGNENPVLKAEIAAPMMLVTCSLAAVILSQVIRADVEKELRLAPLIILPIALVLFFIGIWSTDRGKLPRWMHKVLTAGARWLGIRKDQFVSLSYSLVFSILTCTAGGFLYLMRSPVAAMICWLLGIALVIYGTWQKPAEPIKISRSITISVAVIFALALTIRSIDTANIPIVLSGDEASSGLFSTKYITGEADNLFITGWFSFPSLHNFLQSISIRIFGQTTEALRLLAAFGGALTVALIYLLGRTMFGNLAGWAAAIFLTGMHFHNHFSRIGLNNIWDGFFFVLVLGCTWIGWKKNLRLAWILAGIGLGLAQYFYATGRALFFIVPLWVVIAGLFDRKRLKEAIPNLVVMLWVTLIVVLPLGWFYARNIHEFLAPMERVSIFGDWLPVTAQNREISQFMVLVDQARLGIMGYFAEPTNAWYMPGVPLLRAVPGAVFLMGVAFTLIHPKDERNQLLWVWLFANAAAVASSESAPAAQRYVAAAPALALMVGFGLYQLVQLFIKWMPKRPLIFNIVLITASVLMAADDLRFYYLEYTKNNDFSGFHGQVAQRLAHRLKDEPAGTELLFVGYPYMGYDSIASLPYLAPQIEYYNLEGPWESSEKPVFNSEKVYFVFLPDHDADLAAMEREYPGGTWSEEKYTGAETLYRLYELSNK